MKKAVLLLGLALLSGIGFAQVSTDFVSPLKMEEIMKGEEFVGYSPSRVQWSLDSKKLFFNWKQEGDEIPATYVIDYPSNKIRKANKEEVRSLGISNLSYNSRGDKAVFERNGDLFVYDFKRNKEIQLFETSDREFDAKFINSDKEIAFRKGNQVYSLNLANGMLKQLSHISSSKDSNKGRTSKQKEWLKEQQEFFDVLEDIKSKKEAYAEQKEAFAKEKTKTVYLDAKESLWQVTLSDSGKEIFYLIQEAGPQSEYTDVHNYVTESGYVENLRSRPKVGHDQAQYRLVFQDVGRDTVLTFDPEILPGIKDLPDYLADYPERKKELEKEDKARPVNYSTVKWNDSGTHAIFSIYSQDRKDRWILLFDANKLEFKVADRQRDEAWVGGPGVFSYAQVLDWIDNSTFYFQSEKTGYSHLYTYNLNNSKTTALTAGDYEVQSVNLSKDKKHFYITTNEEHPGITHYYKLQISNKSKTQLTQDRGGHQVYVSPNEKALAILHSTSNSPWELYIKANSPKAKMQQVTHSTTEAFKAYDWREPEMINFKNRHGNEIYARVYTPEVQHENRPAVVFVHGAGYLQNVHYWWSTYHREYMFHNMLADMGYVVIDIDYTASKGYGRDMRTGIYRHMGGTDLTDQVDGVKYLVENYNVNPEQVGIYGGSYGGFITLMALFTEAEVFKSGAALRSVTDWAHYNHGYTSNILNLPYEDPIAYERSSPIYFADGLKGNLLMAHGIIDVNVQFQDIVRLSQRLIELQKDNWELAVYPLEDHGFVHTTSWIDEYKRILKLFEDTLKN